MSGQESTIYDTNDEFIWNSKTTVVGQNGETLSERTIYDDGIVQDDMYEAEMLFASVEQDASDVADWAFRQTLYDENGQIAIQASLLDDGDESYSIYAGGNLLGTLLLDMNGSDTWQVSLTEQAPNGPVTTYYDNAFDLPAPYLDFLMMGVG